MNLGCWRMLLFGNLLKLLDSVFPILRYREKIVKDVVLPFITLPTLLLFGTLSVAATAGVVLLIAIGNLYVASRPKTRSRFFYSWTLSSIVTMCLVFQLFVMKSVVVSVPEITIIFVLALCTSCHFYHMKTIASELMAIATENSTAPLATDAHYCRICRIIVRGRLFHSLWWDCCVSKPNYLYFLSGLMFALVTILYGTNLGLRTLCENTQSLNNILLPVNCINVYESDIRHTLLFVTCMYGIGYSLIVMVVLLRQIAIYIPKYADMLLKKCDQVMIV